MVYHETVNGSPMECIEQCVILVGVRFVVFIMLRWEWDYMESSILKEKMDYNVKLLYFNFLGK